jgi:GAF domain-containing protein
LPVFDKEGNVAMVLDVDSDLLNDFSEVDAEGLGKIMKALEKTL